MAATAVMRFFYRPLVVKYSESLADRGLVRCIFYVGLFNTFLRSMFCFTKEMWSCGEDSGFHMHESGKEKDGVRRFSFDLCNWMRLDLEKMVDLLFDYTYNLGEAELASDQDIEVKTRFETTEDQYDIAAGASGTIVKRKNYGAVYEGSKVFVHFYGDGIKINNLSRSGANLNESPRITDGKGKEWMHKIPIEKNSLAQAGADKDQWQVELKRFLRLKMAATGP